MLAEISLQSLLLLPIASFPFIYLIGRVKLRLNAQKGMNKNPARWLALAVMALMFIPLLLVIYAFVVNGDFETQIGSIPLRMDGVALLLAVVVTVMVSLVILFSGDYMKGEVGEEKYYALLVCMAGMVIGLGAATDLFNLWVWFEAMAIAPYVLVAFYHDRSQALEAGVKYLYQSAVGTMLVLFGIGIIFLHTGSLCLSPQCVLGLSPSPSLSAAGILIIIGFGVKSALVPMHTWLPDAHSQAPSGISAILSGVVIEAGLIAMLRVVDMLSGAFPTAGSFLIALGALNVLLGNLLALRQTQVKRLLAFSSIAHMGVIVIGLGVTMLYDTRNGAQGAFFHIITHALAKGLAFMGTGAMMKALAVPKKDAHAPLMAEDLNGAARQYPLYSLFFAISLLSLGGLPPLAGFMSKWQILVGGFESGEPWLMALMVFMALNSVISLAYYAPLINRLYRNQANYLFEQSGKITKAMLFAMAIIAGLLVVIGAFPRLVEWLTEPAARVIWAAFHQG